MIMGIVAFFQGVINFLFPAITAYADDPPNPGESSVVAPDYVASGDYYGSTNYATPFDILSNNGAVNAQYLDVGGKQAADYLYKASLQGQIATILDFVAVISGIILIIAALVMLIIVNYPKTVAQTKQKVAQVFLTLVAIALLPIIFDAVYTLTLGLIGTYGHY